MEVLPPSSSAHPFKWMRPFKREIIKSSQTERNLRRNYPPALHKWIKVTKSKNVVQKMSKKKKREKRNLEADAVIYF